MFPIINLFGREIGTYAVISFLGFIVCGFVIFFSSKKLKIDVEDICILELVIAAGLLVGGHLLYGLVNLPQIIDVFKNYSALGFKQALETLINCFGGMVFYGGFLGGLASLKIYIHFSKLNTKGYFTDIYAFSIPLFHFFGRIGCFFGGCCYGIESSVGFITYSNNLVPSINAVRRFPVSLLEAALNLIIFIILFNMFKKGKSKNKLIYWYMVFYSAVRFGTEFLRGDQVRGIYFSLSTSQWISIVLLFYGIFSLYKKKYQRI